jgi:hypothetical protein
MSTRPCTPEARVASMSPLSAVVMGLGMMPPRPERDAVSPMARESVLPGTALPNVKWRSRFLALVKSPCPCTLSMMNSPYFLHLTSSLSVRFRLGSLLLLGLAMSL